MVMIEIGASRSRHLSPLGRGDPQPLLGMRHCMMQCRPVSRYEISVLPSKADNADFSNLVPKPGADTLPMLGPSVSSQVTVRRSPLTVHETCNNPRGAENAPYLPALVASS